MALRRRPRWPRLSRVLVALAGYVLVLVGVTFAYGSVTDIVSFGEGLPHALLAGVFSVVVNGLISVPLLGVFGLPALLASTFIVGRVGTTALRALLGSGVTWAAWFGFLAASAAANGFTGPDFPYSAFWLPVWTAAGAVFGIWARRTRATLSSRDIPAR